jgi:hypothetical protein
MGAVCAEFSDKVYDGVPPVVVGAVVVFSYYDLLVAGVAATGGCRSGSAPTDWALYGGVFL